MFAFKSLSAGRVHRPYPQLVRTFVVAFTLITILALAGCGNGSPEPEKNPNGAVQAANGDGRCDPGNGGIELPEGFCATVVADDPPLLRGMVALASLYAIQLAVSKLRHRLRPVERTVDNRPILLMRAGGEMLEANMRVARVTADDLRSVLRKANVLDPADVHAVVMEGTGEVHVLHGTDGRADVHPWLLEGVRDYRAG